MHPPSGIVSLLTDFGSSDPYVGIMKGMICRRHPRAVIVDICHEVPAYDIEIGAFFWKSIVGRFPPGTVHLAVVDPGVGSERGMVAAHAADCYWIAPDNGVLDRVLATAENPSVRSVDIARLDVPTPSNTFHGRDVFAPLAGMLSGGRFGFPAVGPRREPSPLRAVDESPRVLYADHFGNLITTISSGDAAGAKAVEIAGRSVAIARTYADVGVGELLALVNSYDLLEVAVREGNAAETLGVGRGEAVQLKVDSDE